MKKLSFILFLFIFLTFIPNKIISQNTKEVWSSDYKPYDEQSKFVDMSIADDGNIFVVGYVPNKSQSYPTGFHGIFYDKNGKLNESIGSSGKGILEFETELDLSQYSAIDSEGNIILGRTYKYSNNAKIARFKKSVNQSGEEYFEQNLLIQTGMQIHGLKVDKEKNIIIIGENKDATGNKKNIISKYNSNGLPDSTFGDNGIVEVNNLVSIDALAIGEENDIIIAATPLSSTSYANRYLLLKYNSFGELDTIFADQGIFYGEYWRKKITKLEVNNNSDIVVLGYTNLYPQSKLDFSPQTFITIIDSNGSRKFSRQFLTSNHNKPSSLALNNNGEIALSLYTNAVNVHFNTGDGYSRNYIYRLKSNGEIIDSTILPYFTYGNMIKKLIYNDDGSVLLGGTTGFKGGEVITLLHILKNGEFDKQFGRNGILYSSLLKTYIKPVLQDISVDNENNIFILHNKKILKLNNEGKRDSTFNYDGLLANRLLISSIEADNSGGVICGGPLRMWIEYDYSVLLKIKNNAQLDRNFGDWLGVSIVNKYRNGPTHDFSDIILNNNGDIITLLEERKFIRGKELLRGCPFVRKVSSSGLLDSNFNGGIVYDYSENVNSIALDSEGKILYCGKKFEIKSNAGHIIVHRRNSDGSIDKTFNVTGYSTYFDSEGYTVAADSQNRVLVSGVYGSHISIIRFNYNGTIDSEFGNDGILQTPFIQKNAGKKNFVIDKYGRIIVIGSMQRDDDYVMSLARYNENGTIDETFGENGILKSNRHTKFGELIALDNEDNIIAVGISDNKIIIKKYKNSQVVSVKNNDINVPKEYSLSQNYPNPFNPTTTIKYSIPVVDANFASTTKGNENIRSVQIKVYDVLGKEVATLVNEKKPAGNYEVTFNGSNLTSGIYFYCLTSGDFKQTKKLILLK